MWERKQMRISRRNFKGERSHTVPTAHWPLTRVTHKTVSSLAAQQQKLCWYFSFLSSQLAGTEMDSSFRMIRWAMGFPDGASGKDATCQCRRRKRQGFDPQVGEIPWRRAWQAAPGFWSGESHGQRSLAPYGPQTMLKPLRMQACIIGRECYREAKLCTSRWKFSLTFYWDLIWLRIYWDFDWEYKAENFALYGHEGWFTSVIPLPRKQLQQTYLHLSFLRLLGENANTLLQGHIISYKPSIAHLSFCSTIV